MPHQAPRRGQVTAAADHADQAAVAVRQARPPPAAAAPGPGSPALLSATSNDRNHVDRRGAETGHDAAAVHAAAQTAARAAVQIAARGGVSPRLRRRRAAAPLHEPICIERRSSAPAGMARKAPSPKATIIGSIRFGPSGFGPLAIGYGISCREYQSADAWGQGLRAGPGRGRAPSGGLESAASRAMSGGGACRDREDPPWLTTRRQ